MLIGMMRTMTIHSGRMYVYKQLGGPEWFGVCCMSVVQLGPTANSEQGSLMQIMNRVALYL